jgi:hypothetical protein
MISSPTNPVVIRMPKVIMRKVIVLNSGLLATPVAIPIKNPAITRQMQRAKMILDSMINRRLQ